MWFSFLIFIIYSNWGKVNIKWLFFFVFFYCFFIFGFETKEAIQPKKIAEEIPAAAAFVPPMKAPMKPESFTSSNAPFASRFPKPVKGTVAPQPAKSIKYL